MEQSSFVVNEEPSVFPHSEFNPGNQDERELQEEYEDERREIDEDVARHLAENGDDDDDLDLVESESEDEYENHISPNILNLPPNINTMNPLSRNMANIHRTASFDHQSPGIHGQFKTSTQIGQSPSNLYQNHERIPFQQERNSIYSSDSQALAERNFLHKDEEHLNADRLPILYKVREQEIKKLKDEIDDIKKQYEQDTRNLKHELALVKTEENSLIARLESEKENAKLQLEEKRRIKDTADKLSKQLSESENTRNQLEEELHSTKITLNTLHAQHKELQQSDTVFKARQIHEENVSSLRERHEKELFRLHQEISKITQEKNHKDDQIDLLRRNATTVQNNYDSLQLEKNDIIKEYQDRLKDAQNRLQQQISENASYNYTNVKAIEERAREDRERYAQELLKIKDKEEEFLLLQRRNEELKSKYASLKHKVVKYQDHQRKKDEKYREQIRQTDEECRARLAEVRSKTKEAIESKNRQYQDEVLQMQKMFEVEMEKVATMTLRSSKTMLDSENDRNVLNIESNNEVYHSSQVPQPSNFNQKLNQNSIPNLARYEQETKILHNDYPNSLQVLSTVNSETALPLQNSNQEARKNANTNFGNNLEPTTDNLNKVF